MSPCSYPLIKNDDEVARSRRFRLLAVIIEKLALGEPAEEFDRFERELKRQNALGFASCRDIGISADRQELGFQSSRRQGERAFQLGNPSLRRCQSGTTDERFENRFDRSFGDRFDSIGDLLSRRTDRTSSVLEPMADLASLKLSQTVHE